MAVEPASRVAPESHRSDKPHLYHRWCCMAGSNAVGTEPPNRGGSQPAKHSTPPAAYHCTSFLRSCHPLSRIFLRRDENRASDGRSNGHGDPDNRANRAAGGRQAPPMSSAAPSRTNDRKTSGTHGRQDARMTGDGAPDISSYRHIGQSGHSRLNAIRLPPGSRAIRRRSV